MGDAASNNENSIPQDFKILGLSTLELGFLGVFWTTVILFFTFVEVNWLDLTVVVVTVNSLSWLLSKLPFLMSTAILVGSLIGAFVFRETLAKYIILILKKIMRGRR
mmetsp:Transcript_74323/g.124036  ORF Transcript_74323/g.124036 Transcript_74323/m.124036 type:complete len:107 (-) Transcript_74323:338-658(-)